MWKDKHYIVDIDRCSECDEQKVTCTSSEVIRKRVTIKQFEEIMKIIGEDNA